MFLCRIVDKATSHFPDIFIFVYYGHFIFAGTFFLLLLAFFGDIVMLKSALFTFSFFADEFLQIGFSDKNYSRAGDFVD
jgi:hypothetical protein